MLFFALFSEKVPASTKSAWEPGSQVPRFIDIWWGGREAEEQKGGVEGEGGGEDEGGEGVALCQSVEGEVFTTTWEDFACKLID